MNDLLSKGDATIAFSKILSNMNNDMSAKPKLVDSPVVKWLMIIITIFSFGWGLYQAFHVKNPKLQYEVVSQVNIVNKTEDMSSIRLLVDSIDVLATDKNISYFVLKVSNTGNQHLRENDYDSGRFGLQINGGEIMQEPLLYHACNSHIEERFYDQLLTSTDNLIEIPRISLDIDDWYTISFSVIHDNSVNPTFDSVGKVIGQRDIQILSSHSDENEESIWRLLFKGNLMVNVLRLLVFTVIGLLIAVFFAFIATTLSDMLIERQFARARSQIAQDSSIQSFIRDDYLNYYCSYAEDANNYYQLGVTELNKLYKLLNVSLSNPRTLSEHEMKDTYQELNKIERLISKGYLICDSSGVISIPIGAPESVKKVIEIHQKRNTVNAFIQRLTGRSIVWMG